jgi:hypothetical protein
MWRDALVRPLLDHLSHHSQFRPVIFNRLQQRF